jgi:class 3 adenylate cyclase
MTAPIDLRDRLLAIMAADVAGYSRMMSTDGRATLAALDRARDVFRRQIAAQGGRVIDMAGDSVLAVFETAAAAVQSALAVQQELAESELESMLPGRMQFRIGVHVGDLLEKPDGTVYGDGVNIAARLESLASPGGIAISSAVHDLVSRRVTVDFQDLGEQKVKNIEHPVRAWGLGTLKVGEPEVAVNLNTVTQRSHRSRRVVLAVAATALLASMAWGVGHWWTKPTLVAVQEASGSKGRQGAPALSVRPFSSLDDQPGGQQFAAGLGQGVIRRPRWGLSSRRHGSCDRHAGPH